ncbi:MAG: hypothetical protein SFZ23_15860, partial [Planctomycetota bacterium]|nr:hypothetical protein [Planctomycetota bacterium]
MTARWTGSALLVLVAMTGCGYRYLGAYEVRGVPFDESELEAITREISPVIAPLGYTRMPAIDVWSTHFERRNSPEPGYAELSGSKAHVVVAIALPVFGDGIDIVINDAANQGETPFVAETKRVIVEFLRERYGIEAPKFRRRMYMGSRTTDSPRQGTTARRADSVLASASSGRWFAAGDHLCAGENAPVDLGAGHRFRHRLNGGSPLAWAAGQVPLTSPIRATWRIEGGRSAPAIVAFVSGDTQ